MLTARPVGDWLRSLERHIVRGTNLLHVMIARCPIWPQNASGLAHLYEAHMQRAREAVAAARCGTVVEVGRADAGEALARAFPGTAARCWMQQHRYNETTHRTDSLQFDAAQGKWVRAEHEGWWMQLRRRQERSAKAKAAREKAIGASIDRLKRRISED